VTTEQKGSIEVRRDDALVVTNAPAESEVTLQALIHAGGRGVRSVGSSLFIGYPDSVEYEITGWNADRGTFSVRRIGPSPDDAGTDEIVTWPEGGIATRERCTACHRISTVGFHVPDEVWKVAVHPSLVHSVLCLACFTDRADARMVDWSKDIEFYAVSLVEHLREAWPRYSPSDAPPLLDTLRGAAKKAREQGDDALADQIEMKVAEWSADDVSPALLKLDELRRNAKVSVNDYRLIRNELEGVSSAGVDWPRVGPKSSSLIRAARVLVEHRQTDDFDFVCANCRAGSCDHYGALWRDLREAVDAIRVADMAGPDG
jgi:hypothetical protein